VKKAGVLTVVSMVAFIASVWCGSYFYSVAPGWAKFPVYMTSCVVVLMSIATFSLGLMSVVKSETQRTTNGSHESV